jgi:hypothetical protein
VYFDNKPCAVCGSEVELRARETAKAPETEPVGPKDGVVGAGDDTPDERVCTNRECPSHTGSASA